MSRARALAFLCLPLALACGDDDAPGVDGGPDQPDAAAPACDPDAPGTICTIAGNGQSGYDGDDDIVAREARMGLPQDALVAPDGNLYILDWNNHRVRALTPDGVLRHVAGRGELGGTLDDPANSDFNHPTGLLLAPDGELLIAAWHNSKIRAIDLTDKTVADVVGDGRRAYFGDDSESGPIALDLPTSIAFDPDGLLVIMDQANQVIRRVGADGVIHRIAGQCIVDVVPAGGAACAVDQEPVLCPGGSGKFTCGDPATTCGTPCGPSYAIGDDVLTMRMNQPFGQSADPGGRMVFEPDGDLIFADAGNHLIRRITTAGAVEIVAGVAPEGGVPQSGVGADGTAATEALLDRPTDLALAADGTLYFTDVYNHCVRKVATDGTIATVAGVCGEKGYAGDGGPPTAALLKFPYGIELAGDRLYIADTGNDVVRVVNL